MANDIKSILDRLDNKLDQIDQRLTSLDITSGKQSVILEEHQRRSAANEENIEMLREQIKPIEHHVIMVNSFFKGLGMISTIVGVVAGICKIFNFSF